MLNANLARLVDIMEYWLDAEYARWTTDPADLRRARARNARNRIEPPPFPLVRPVAARPPSVHAELQEHFDALVAGLTRSPVGRAEFDRRMGIETEVQGDLRPHLPNSRG